jgi:hypothetical protein
MTERYNRSVVIRLVGTTKTGDQETVFFGPFLPHVGSRCTSFESTLRREEEISGRWRNFETFIEDVFIGADESDAVILAYDDPSIR